MRDAGHTLQHCADSYGLATRQQARTLWISALRRAGREGEIQTRQIGVRFGGQTYLVDSNDLSDTFIFAPGYTWTTFGAEVECYNAGYRRATQALRQVSLEAEQEGYNHYTRDYWKITSDASITGNNACEVVSPVLRGDDGLRELRTAMMALRDSDARVNQSCGGHIHIGVNGWIDEVGQAAIIRRWWKINRAMEMLVLPSRRNNRWCKRTDQARSERLAAEWASGDKSGGGDRYYELNLQAWGRQGTFENRLHNGSLNGKNHGAWVILNQAVMLFLSQSTEAEVNNIFGDEFCHHNGTVVDNPEPTYCGRTWEEHYDLYTQNLPQTPSDDAIARLRADFDSRAFVLRRGVTDEECEAAMRRLIMALLNRMLITPDVAAHLNARVEWIKNRNNRGEASRGA
jgi:hypothetical protein